MTLASSSRGWLWLHESGTYVKFTQSGADLSARFWVGRPMLLYFLPTSLGGVVARLGRAALLL